MCVGSPARQHNCHHLSAPFLFWQLQSHCPVSHGKLRQPGWLCGTEGALWLCTIFLLLWGCCGGNWRYFPAAAAILFTVKRLVAAIFLVCSTVVFVDPRRSDRCSAELRDSCLPLIHLCELALLGSGLSLHSNTWLAAGISVLGEHAALTLQWGQRIIAPDLSGLICLPRGLFPLSLDQAPGPRFGLEVVVTLGVP